MPTLVVQMGHCYRTTGATGTAGEQQFATATANVCLALLNGRGGWTVRKILADESTSAYQGDAFVAVHCDGSTSAAARGASVGYRTPEGQALGQAWKRAYAARGWPGFRPDNYTTALAQYYGTGNAVAQGNRRAVIIECGFLTNPDDRALLTSPDGPERVALAIGDALGIPLPQEEDMPCLFNTAPGGDRTILQSINARLSGLVGMDPTTSDLGDPAGDYPMPLIGVLDTMSKVVERVGADVAELKARPAADVDEAVLAADLAPLLPALGLMPESQFAELVDAVNDENDRRAAERANTPVSPA